LLGCDVGCVVGAALGIPSGDDDGAAVECAVGVTDGASVSCTLGQTVGGAVGAVGNDDETTLGIVGQVVMVGQFVGLATGVWVGGGAGAMLVMRDGGADGSVVARLLGPSEDCADAVSVDTAVGAVVNELDWHDGGDDG
jgi:hypothetical protein